MRSVAGLLLLALLVPVPASLAQDMPLPATVTIDDPAGDLEGFVPAEGAGFVDLVHAEVRPTEAALEFAVSVADLSTDAASGIQWELWLDFDYRGTVFHLAVLAQTSAPIPDDARDRVYGAPAAVLYEMAGDFPPPLVRLPAFLDTATRTWNTSLPWEAIQDPAGNRPQPGEPLRLREVATIWDLTLAGSPHQGFPVSVAGTSAEDAAVFPEGTFLSVPGAVGDLALTTPLPVRSSNGEATTFHWPVQVSNRGGRELDVAFTLDAAGGEGRVPPGLHLAPGANATINVYVTVPFVHEHGTTRAFPLTASAGPNDRATLQLGVDYPAIAQPAGHHPDLYLHTSVQKLQGTVEAQGGPLWMNTLEDDPSANAALLMPREGNCPIGDTIDAPPPVGPIEPVRDFGSSWDIVLDPALSIGLDGRMGDLSSLDVELVSRDAAPPGMFYGRLTRFGEEFVGGPFANHTDEFRAAVPVPATLGPGSVSLHLDLPMPPALDLVAPSRIDNLVLALLLCLDAPSPAGASLVTFAFTSAFAQSPYALAAGGHLRLAVDEYHDVLPIAPSNGGLALAVDEAVVHAAPGATILWRPTLSFPADASGEHAVRLFGTGAAHARLLGPDHVSGPGDVQLPVSFVVPDVAAGEVFDLLLDVTHTQDPTRAVGLRLGVVVDPAATRDDAAQLAVEEAKGKDAPGPAPGLVLLALALLALRRRA